MSKQLARPFRVEKIVAILTLSLFGAAGCSSVDDIPDQFEKDQFEKDQTGGGMQKLSLPAIAAPDMMPDITLISYDKLPGWSQDRHADALIAFQKSCQKFQTLPAQKTIEALGITATIGQWQKVCRQAMGLSVTDHLKARLFFEQNFQPYQLHSGQGSLRSGPEQGLFTGYYVPELKGCLFPRADCQIPVYQKPDDLISADLGQFHKNLKGKRIVGRLFRDKLVPYADRGKIEAGALNQKGLELLYLEDRTEAFFLHIQGSGRVVLDNGQHILIGYAAQNGHAYKSIGRELVKRGEMDLSQASMHSIKSWVNHHPDQADELFAVNKSYVFFRPLKTQAVVGSQGVELTPGRSLAVDRRYIEMGFPVWIDLDDATEPKGKLQRLMVAQDTGGAIKGVVRGDFFWGYGPAAGKRAGRMKSTGKSVVLIPRSMRVR